MYYCKSCGCEFEKSLKCRETHGFKVPPFEESKVCPHCKETKFYEKQITHCRCCGARLSENNKGYCSEACKKAGEKLRELEKKRRNLVFKSPLAEVVRETDEYNRKNNTEYSYGQYVALIRPLKRRKNRRV